WRTVRLFVLFAGAALVPAFGQKATPAAQILGLWGTTVSFGPEIRGALTITQGRDGWRATIGGESAAGELKDREFRFSIPKDKGSFRGRREGKASRGHWSQPVGRATGGAGATAVAIAPA